MPPVGGKLRLYLLLVLLSTLHHRGAHCSAGTRKPRLNQIRWVRGRMKTGGGLAENLGSQGLSRSPGEGRFDDHLSLGAGDSGLVGRKASASPETCGPALPPLFFGLSWRLQESRPVHPRPPARDDRRATSARHREGVRAQPDTSKAPCSPWHPKPGLP